MIDREKVITQVKQGNYPPHWHVYHGQGNFGCLILCWLCTAFFCLFGMVIFSSGMTLGLYWLCLVILPCIGVSLVATFKLVSSEKSILVIFPTGAIQCFANDVENAAWLYFPNIDRIKIAQQTEIAGIDGDINSKTYYWLDVYCRDGTYLKWGIRGCFGDTASICKTIIATYNLYRNYNRFLV